MVQLSFPLPQAFVALPLEGHARDAFQEVQRRLEPYAELFRFQNPSSPHLTLHFWGELMEIEHGDVVRKVKSVADRTAPFSLRATGVGTFDNRRPPKVLFLTVDRCEELACLKKLCPWPNIKPFHAHITLARMRNPHSFIVHRKKIAKRVKDIAFDIPIDRMRLYAEVDEVKQTPLQDFVFSGT